MLGARASSASAWGPLEGVSPARRCQRSLSWKRHHFSIGLCHPKATAICRPRAIVQSSHFKRESNSRARASHFWPNFGDVERLRLLDNFAQSILLRLILRPPSTPRPFLTALTVVKSTVVSPRATCCCPSLDSPAMEHSQLSG